MELISLTPSPEKFQVDLNHSPVAAVGLCFMGVLQGALKYFLPNLFLSFKILNKLPAPSLSCHSLCPHSSVSRGNVPRA